MLSPIRKGTLPNRRHSQNPETDICDLVLYCGKQQQDPARMLCAEYDEDGCFIGIVKELSVDPAAYMPVSLDVDASSTLRMFAIDSASAAPLANEAECPPVADEEKAGLLLAHGVLYADNIIPLSYTTAR